MKKKMIAAGLAVGMALTLSACDFFAPKPVTAGSTDNVESVGNEAGSDNALSEMAPGNADDTTLDGNSADGNVK